MATKKDPMAAFSEARRERDLAMAQALIIREAAVDASQTFRHYAEIHRGKGDEDKARRNEDEAYRLTVAIMATANLPDFRVHSARLEADLARVTAERDALKTRLDDYEDDHRAVVAGKCAPDEVHCSCVPHLRREVEAMRAVVEAARGVAAGRNHVVPMGGGILAGYKIQCAVVDDLNDALDALDALRTRKGGG